MFLILDQQQTSFSQKLMDNATARGISSIYLTSQAIVHDVLLDYRLTDHEEKFVIRTDNFEFSSAEIYGVYCGLNNFWPGLWPDFSIQDAQYAAQETYALWLAMLSSLSCRVINQPALDTLAGSLLSVPETLYYAQQKGLRIPLNLTLESSQSAAPLLQSSSIVHYINLGKRVELSGGHLGNNMKPDAENDNHCRITEIVSGKLVNIAMVGDRVFISDNGMEGISTPLDIKIPDKVYFSLSSLKKFLNLNMAEFYFRISPENSWIFSGYGRVPENAVTAFGDDIIDYIISYAIGNGGS